MAGPFDSPRYDQPVTHAPTPLLPYPPALQAPGTAGAPFSEALPVAELSPGTMRRVSFGDLDVLLVHTDRGVCAVEDRCPHMSAPLSIGDLEGCVIACPLHSGRFDLATGDPVQMPTTGGLWPDGGYEPMWTPPGRDERPEPPGRKAEARRLTRVRRVRYFPLRVRDGMFEVALPR